MLDSAPLCSKPAPSKLDVHSTTLLTGDAGGYHCECSCFDRSNAGKEGVAPAAAPRPRREGLVLRVIVAEERL